MILVTGGAGFIGSNLVAGLAQRGHSDITVCDQIGHGDKWRNLAKHEVADIIAPERLRGWLDERGGAAVEAVVHLGAISSTVEADVDKLVANNFRLSVDLWEWCTRHAVRLIYASSAATYGDGSAGFDDDGSPAALAQLRPLNAYAWTKHLFDRHVARIVASKGRHPPQWVGLKFFNVYGPNEYHKGAMRSVAEQVFRQVSHGGSARLFRSYRPDVADGGQRRDFVWVGDCVAVIAWLLDSPSVSGLFNLGSGTARSFAELAGAVFKAMDRAAAIEFIDMPPELRERYQYFSEARLDRLRAAGCRHEFTSLEDGVQHYVQRYLGAADPYC